MDNISVAAVRLDTLILYRYDLDTDSLSSFIKSSRLFLQSEIVDKNSIYIADDSIILQEWTKYKVKSIDNSFSSNDFIKVGEFGDSGFGIVQFKNSIGYGTFKHHRFLIQSQKISLHDLNNLVKIVNSYILNLSYDFNQSTASAITRSANKKTDLSYHTYLLLHNAFVTENKSQNLFNNFHIIESNPNRLLTSVGMYEDINSLSEIDSDSLNELFNGGALLSKTDKLVPLSEKLSVRGKHYLPKELYTEEIISSYNNKENQFIKFFFEWSKSVISYFQNIFLKETDFKSSELINDNNNIIEEINTILRQSFLAQVDSSATIPMSSTVLTQRAGYRQIFKTFIGIKSLPLNDDSLNVKELIDNKSIDVLYENYCFFLIADLLSDIYGQKLSKKRFKVYKTDYSKTLLKQTNSNYFEFSNNPNYPDIRIHYNKNYTVDSYSKPYDPDIALEIINAGNTSCIYLFDSKFKATIRDISDEGNEVLERTKTYKYDDISKMHTYRDAIKKANGAFILYPGTKKEVFYLNSDYDKSLLFGVGAFPLNPGNQNDMQDLRKTLSDLLLNFA